MKAIELAQVKHLQEKQRKASEKAQWIDSKKQYYLRCQHYLRDGYDSQLDNENSSLIETDSDDLNIDDMKSVIKEAHQKHNDHLLTDKTFPGCHYHKVGCDCYWRVGIITKVLLLILKMLIG